MENTEPISIQDAQRFLNDLTDWSIFEGKFLEKEYTFIDFTAAMEFINNVAKIAKQEDHHPDILLHKFNKVKITLTTHIAHGLTKSDFIVAESIEKLITIDDM